MKFFQDLKQFESTESISTHYSNIKDTIFMYANISFKKIDVSIAIYFNKRIFINCCKKEDIFTKRLKIKIPFIEIDFIIHKK